MQSRGNEPNRAKRRPKVKPTDEGKRSSKEAAPVAKKAKVESDSDSSSEEEAAAPAKKVEKKIMNQKLKNCLAYCHGCTVLIGFVYPESAKKNPGTGSLNCNDTVTSADYSPNIFTKKQKQNKQNSVPK